MLMVLVTYDVNLADPDGKRRLRKIAKECMNHGQRVQNSVFECWLDWSEFERLKHRLQQFADLSVDSLRFYQLGSNYKEKIEHFGAKQTYMPDDLFIF